MFVLAGLNFNESCKQAVIGLKIMTVSNLYLFETLMFVKRNVHIIECDTVTHSYDTRAKNFFH
jgi:hypothetical protein